MTAQIIDRTDIKKITLNVTSEIGRLRQVGIHYPGDELKYMTPSNKDALLFDDILLADYAQKEHEEFQQMMEVLMIHTYQVVDLLGKVLTDPPSDLMEQVIKIQENTEKKMGNKWVPAYRTCIQHEFDNKLMKDATMWATKLITGICANAEDATALKFRQRDDPFLLTPIPNILFMRDPAAVVGNNVIVGKMTKPARQREAYLLHLIFNYILAKESAASRTNKLFDFFDEKPENELDDGGLENMNVEGGDILVINSETLAIGCSERTTPEFVQEAISRMFHSATWKNIKTIIAILMPKQRSTMHLDTIFTMINKNECLVYAPMILARGREQVTAIRYTVDSEGKLNIYQEADVVTAVENAMRGYLHNRAYTLTAYPCGGEDPIHQEREQWNDGANVLALAPGVIVGYNRNLKTFSVLHERANYKIVDASEIIQNHGLSQKIIEAMDNGSGEKFAIRIPGYELSRARGGPRCMTMPFQRDEVHWEEGLAS